MELEYGFYMELEGEVTVEEDTISTDAFESSQVDTYSFEISPVFEDPETAVRKLGDILDYALRSNNPYFVKRRMGEEYVPEDAFSNDNTEVEHRINWENVEAKLFVSDLELLLASLIRAQNGENSTVDGLLFEFARNGFPIESNIQGMALKLLEKKYKNKETIDTAYYSPGEALEASKNISFL